MERKYRSPADSKPIAAVEKSAASKGRRAKLEADEMTPMAMMAHLNADFIQSQPSWAV